MNPQLAQALSARLGLDPEQTAALASGDVRSVLAAKFAGDPMMMQLIEQMQAPAAPALEAADPDEVPMSGILRHEVAELRQALAAAHTMIRFVGQVMGACQCWGRDRHCTVCAGFGAPGFKRSSNPQMLLAWVEPGLARLGARIVRTTPKQSPPTEKTEEVKE